MRHWKQRLYGEEASKKSNDLRGRLDELLNIRSNEEEATEHGFMQSGRDSEQRFSSGKHVIKKNVNAIHLCF